MLLFRVHHNSFHAIFCNESPYTLEMGCPHWLNQNFDAQCGLTQVSSPLSNPASMRLMCVWLCYTSNIHINVPPDKKPFWFITTLQDAMKEVTGCGFHEARDKFNTLLLALSALRFHLMTSLDTTEVEIYVTFSQVPLFTKNVILHSLATVQCFRSRTKPQEI